MASKDSFLDTYAQALFKQPVERLVLPNGLVVLLKADPSAPVVSTQLWVKTGSIHEGQHLGSGISHYVEHMLFKGTSRRSYQQISEHVHAAGGQVNAYTSFDRTVYYIDGPMEGLELYLDVLADISLNSILEATEATKEKDVILREIDMCMDDPDTQLGQELFRTAYREHPYRYPVIGLRPIFEGLTQQELLMYYKKHYTCANMVLVIVGDISLQAVQAAVERYFGQNSLVDATLQPCPSEPLQLAFRESRLYGDYAITRGSMAFKIPGLRHADAPTLDILAMLLGHGQSALLYQELRENQKLVQDISAFTWNPGESGLLWVSYTCDPSKRQAVEEAVLAELEHLAQRAWEPSAIDKAVRQAMVGEINTYKTMQGQASRLGAAEVIIGDREYPQLYLKKLGSVTPADLQRVLQAYLRSERLSTVTLEPLSQKAVQVAAASSAPALPDFEEKRLPNGVPVLLQPWPHFPKVHIKAVLLGGPLYEHPAAYGATALLSTLLTKATRKRSSLEVAQAIEAAGGYFGEFAGNNTFGLSLEVLPEDLPLAVDLLAEALCAPAFLEDAFELERASQIACLQEEMDEIVPYAKRELKRHFFGSHPHHSHTLGSEASLAALTLEHLRDHWKRLVRASNLVIAVTGAFEPEVLTDALATALAPLPAGSLEHSWAQAFTLPATTGLFQSQLNREQAIVLQAYLDVGIKHPDFEVGEVLDELFSGMSSQLFKRVREELGLAYFVGASRFGSLDMGMFSFCAGTQQQSVQAVMAEIDAEIQRVQSGSVTQVELDRCKTRLKAQKQMSLQSLGSRAMEAALAFIYGFPANHWRGYSARIDRVSLAHLQAFAKERLVPEKAVKVIVTPSE